MSQVLKVRNPRTGEYDYTFTAPDASSLRERTQALRAEQQDWESLGLEGRQAVMEAFAKALETNTDAIAAALEIDTGRRRIARMEVQGTIASIRGWIAQTSHLALDDAWIEGRANPSFKHRPQWMAYSLVGVISPWNFPLTLSMIDTIPALLAGCAVMIKPSEVTPRFAAPFLDVIKTVPELAKVLDIAPGDGMTGAALVDQADLICFTGSVATGRKVGAQAGANLIPAFLELGGKDPLLVLEGAPLDLAVRAALRGSVLSTGQACQSIERVYVHRSLYDAFVPKLVEAAQAVRFNWPSIEAGEIGPMIFDRQADIIQAQWQDAVAKGATILTGGTVETHGGGRWIAPTVITNVTHDMAIMREETFGPVIPVMAFDSVEEALALANDTEFGLSAAVFGPDVESAEAVARHIEAGAISINDAALTALFHEAEKQSFKASGMGPSRMGLAGYTRFFRRKALIANTGEPAPIQAFCEDADGAPPPPSRPSPDDESRPRFPRFFRR